MKNIPIVFLIASLLSLGVIACEPYEEGPKVSLRTKTSRLVNSWDVEFVYENETDITSYFTDWMINIKEDGRFTLTDLVDNVQTVQEGFWSFTENYEGLTLIYTDPPVNPDRTLYTIQRLKKDELWLWEETDSSIRDVRLVPIGSAE